MEDENGEESLVRCHSRRLWIAFFVSVLLIVIGLIVGILAQPQPQSESCVPGTTAACKNTLEPPNGPSEPPSLSRFSTSPVDMSSSPSPLNILLLYADDWRHDTLGVAGNPVVKTPALDRLASNGIRFTHNCVTTSVCWISRATLVTGQYMSRHGQTKVGNPLLFYERSWNETYPALLQERGYYTGQVGKWQFRTYPRHKYNFTSPDTYGWHWMEVLPNGRRKKPKPQRSYSMFNGTMVHITKQNEEDAIKFLKQRPKDAPFALTVSFYAPHAVSHDPGQYFPQNKSLKLYNDSHITVPLNGIDMDESWERLPEFFDEEMYARKLWRRRYNETEKAERMMKNFYRMETEVDEACGRIIDELERQGVLNNTMIIFTTDNGMFHGEHGLAGKWYPYEESIRVPLIIQDPRMPRDKIGTVNGEFTLSIDLAPTMIAAAGIGQPSRMQGRDVSELYLSDKEKALASCPWRDEFLHEYPSTNKKYAGSDALIRKNFKYVKWPGHNVVQLFDLVRDPYEENDLMRTESGRQMHAERIAEMNTRLKELKAAAL